MTDRMWWLTRKWQLALVTVAAGAAFVAPVLDSVFLEEGAGAAITVASGPDNGSGTDDTPWD